MTGRLYYDDAYLTRFEARIVDRGCDACEVYLDRTAFYPTSGGQPFDTGTINGVSVIDVLEEGERILHRVAKPVNRESVECQVDWRRRFDHMQQHSGQHLLSAVFVELFGAQTVSFHLGAGVSTIDLERASLSAEQLRAAESRANELVTQNQPLSVSYEDAEQAAGLRGESKRAGTLRIVGIGDYDRSACGGTHVRSTGEIGAILLRKTEKVRDTLRVEFRCGRRAIEQARSDYDALDACARVFSSALEDAPGLVAAQQEKLAAADRDRKRLTRELGSLKGRELYRQTEAGPNGLRVFVRQEEQGPIADEIRAEAQAFVEGEKAAYVCTASKPALLLVAVSKDSGLHAGNLARETLQAAGGRGGGNPQLAQGSLPGADAVNQAVDFLAGKLRTVSNASS
jgi:alanyl-tRNA synthetase